MTSPRSHILPSAVIDRRYRRFLNCASLPALADSAIMPASMSPKLTGNVLIITGFRFLKRCLIFRFLIDRVTGDLFA
jgi:hypothetical protein